MMHELKCNLDCITDSITFALVFIKVMLILADLPSRLLEGITKKDIGIFQCLFSLFETSETSFFLS